MCDPDLPENRDRLRRMGRWFVVLGSTTTLVSGTFLVFTHDAWVSNSLWWGGLLSGIVFGGLGVMMWRDAVLAPPLTLEQRRYHELLREWAFYDPPDAVRGWSEGLPSLWLSLPARPSPVTTETRMCSVS